MRIQRREGRGDERVACFNAGVEQTDCWRVWCGRSDAVSQVVDELPLVGERPIRERLSCDRWVTNLRQIIQHTHRRRQLPRRRPYEHDATLAEDQSGHPDGHVSLFGE